MFKQSAILLLKYKMHVAFVCVGALVLAILGDYSTSKYSLLFPEFLIWAYLATAIHIHLLKEEEDRELFDYKTIFGFAGRTFVISAISILPMIIFIITNARSFSNTNNNLDLVLFMLYASLFLLAGFLLAFTFLGTMLPAFIADKNKGVMNAIRRGKNQFGFISWRLLVGPTFICVLSLIPILIYSTLATDVSDKIISSDLIDSLQQILIFLLLFFIQAYSVVMTAWILSKAFLRNPSDQDLKMEPPSNL